jgi:sigma-B regulation protein RsbU (phosphoserine phosphatase)
MFGMDSHGGLFFTFWYGVYSRGTRRLRYASAGHHPAYLVDPCRNTMQPLRTRNPVIGAMPDLRFADAQADVAPGSTLFIFSDGVFEVESLDGRTLALADFTPLLLGPAEDGVSEPERLRRRVRERMRAGPWADDFSLVAVKFLS